MSNMMDPRSKYARKNFGKSLVPQLPDPKDAQPAGKTKTIQLEVNQNKSKERLEAHDTVSKSKSPKFEERIAAQTQAAQAAERSLDRDQSSQHLPPSDSKPALQRIYTVSLIDSC